MCLVGIRIHPQNQVVSRNCRRAVPTSGREIGQIDLGRHQRRVEPDRLPEMGECFLLFSLDQQAPQVGVGLGRIRLQLQGLAVIRDGLLDPALIPEIERQEIGRASCRERV